MGTFKREEAKKADTALVDAPASAIDARTKIIAQLSLIDELLKEPPDNNYEQSAGRALVHTGSNTGIFISLAQQCDRLAQLNCVFHGYNKNNYLRYNFGYVNDYLTSVNLVMSTTRRLTVVVVNQDGDTEVPMSNEIGSTFTIGSNTFSNYIGDYYITQDYDTNELLNVDDHIGVFVSPSPYLPQNLINGEIAIKPEDGDIEAPTSATDTRFDFRISNSGVTVADIYTPQTVHNIKLNSVSNDVSFVAGETLLSGDITMTLDTVSAVNTATMSVDIAGISRIERGNTGFEISEQVQGLSSGAFGYVGTVNTSFRWSVSSTGAELTDDLISTIDGFDQGTFSQTYGTMNLVSYVAPSNDALYPAMITMHHDLKAGVANTRNGQLYSGADANTVSLGPPSLGKTIPLRRWRDHDEDNPAHTTGLLAILSARGLQINYDWFVANNRHEGGLNHDEVTKLDNDTFVPFLGWGANTDITLVGSTRRTENRSSTANNGSNNTQYTSGLDLNRINNEHYYELEKNAFYPASVEDMPDNSSPYAGIYAYWDDAYNNGAGAVGFAIHSELRWRYQPNPFLVDYHRNFPDTDVYNSITLPGYSDGTKNTSLETIRDLRADDPLDYGILRLLNSQYDGYQTNTYSFQWNGDGDTVVGPSATISDWNTTGTSTFTIPAWTRDTGSQYPWNNDSTPTVSSTYKPYPEPGPGDFHAFGGTVYAQANNTTGVYPFSAAAGHPEPGVYYIKQENQYGPRIYKVTGTYHTNTTVVTSNSGSGGSGTSSNTTYYNHHLSFTSEEWQNPLNLYGRIFDSNDWQAVADTLPYRMMNVLAGTNANAYPDGHWNLYLGDGERNQDAKHDSYSTSTTNTYNIADLDLDSATIQHINEHAAVLKEFEDSFLTFMNGLGNDSASAQTWTTPYDTYWLKDGLLRIRAQLLDWKSAFNDRMGYPVANSAQGKQAGGYSQALYEISDLLINDDVGPLTKAGNAIKNLDGVYDDIISNRTKYRIMS